MKKSRKDKRVNVFKNTLLSITRTYSMNTDIADSSEKVEKLYRDRLRNPCHLEIDILNAFRMKIDKSANLNSLFTRQEYEIASDLSKML